MLKNNLGTSAILYDQIWIRKNGWAEALRCYMQLRNRTPNINTDNKTPHQIITGHSVNLNNTYKYKFGDIVSYGIPKELREWKLDIRNQMHYIHSFPKKMKNIMTIKIITTI
jgi:hypothetical protein